MKNLRPVQSVLLLLLLGMILGGCRDSGKSSRGPIRSLQEVSVTTPVFQDFPIYIKTPGMVLPFEEADLFSWVTGFVGEVPVDIGSKVRKGDILATIHVPDLSNRFLKALASFQLKLVVMKRYQRSILETPDVVSQGEVDQAKALYLESLAELHQLGKVLQLTVIRAPFKGTITRRFINTGDLTRAAGTGGQHSTPLFRIENTDLVRVAVDLPQPYVNMIRPGVPATIQLVEPHVTMTGTISLISGSLNRISKTMPIQAVFDNPAHILKPGMFVSVGMLLRTLPHVLTIPDRAIVSQDKHPVVYVVSSENRILIRPVTLGEDDGVRVQVMAGLSPTDRVVTRGKHEVMAGDEVLARMELP